MNESCMKKILIISQNFYPEIGSAGNRMKNMYLLLRDQGYDVTVLTIEPTYPNRKIYGKDIFWDDDDLNNDINIKRIRINRKKYSKKILNRLFYYLKVAIKMSFYVLKNKNKYDYVIATSPPIFIAIVGLFAKYRYKAKLVLDIRDLWPQSLKGVNVFNYSVVIKLFEKIETIMYSKASNIIVNSEGFINYISSQSKSFKDKITYIPNGARKSEIVAASDKTYTTFRVIYAGNIGLAQDDRILMELSKELQKRNIDLTIIGYGIRREYLKEFVQSEDLKNVTFLKPLTREECFKIISEHQVGIVTLVDKDVFKTVLPGKIIDYMTCGVPIVGSVSGFAKKVITEQNTGFVSNEHSAKDLLIYIDKLRQSRKLQEEMSFNGKKFVENNFLWEKNIESLVKILY